MEVYANGHNTSTSAAPPPEGDTLRLRRGDGLGTLADPTDPARTVNARRPLHGADGQQPKAAGILLDGWAFRYVLLPDGRRQILGFLVPGDPFGLDDLILGGGQATVETLTRATYQPIHPGRLLDRLAGDPGRCLQLVGALVEERRRLELLVAAIGRCQADERLARFLLDVEARLAARGLVRDGSFPLPLVQQHLADHLGLSVVHVNRTLQRLRRARLITLRDRRAVIHDRERLLSWAGPAPG